MEQGDREDDRNPSRGDEVEALTPMVYHSMGNLDQYSLTYYSRTCQRLKNFTRMLDVKTITSTGKFTFQASTMDGEATYNLKSHHYMMRKARS